ncbi:MAG TPA: response regulator [Steroidobacteraceae bacterium]|nr:response regulator [Steroidobacteraceae bacterium]
MSLQQGTVFIVDDDPDVCRAVGRLVRGAGYEVREYNSARDFLVAHESEPPGCLLLDLSMPEVDGLQLQQSLAAAGCHRPIVFLSANGDVHNTVRAMKAGAVNFLTKPVDRDELIGALTEAFAIDAAGRAKWETRHTIAGRMATLTPRERQVLEKVVAGRLNKQIAAELGTVEKTIKVHRSRVMQKLRAGSLIQLIEIANLGGVSATHDA